MRFWISPQGKEISVAEHALYFYDHPREFGYTDSDVEEALASVSPDDTSLWFESFLEDVVMNKGWIRVLSMGSELNFYCDWKPRSKDHIFQFLVNHQNILGGIRTIGIENSVYQRTRFNRGGRFKVIHKTVSELITDPEELFESSERFRKIMEMIVGR